jgi:hypothetical protein
MKPGRDVALQDRKENMRVESERLRGQSYEMLQSPKNAVKRALDLVISRPPPFPPVHNQSGYPSGCALCQGSGGFHDVLDLGMLRFPAQFLEGFADSNQTPETNLEKSPGAMMEIPLNSFSDSRSLSPVTSFSQRPASAAAQNE